MLSLVSAWTWYHKTTAALLQGTGTEKSSESQTPYIQQHFDETLCAQIVFWKMGLHPRHLCTFKVFLSTILSL